MHVCVKMMLKGSKEALTVLIVTHVTSSQKSRMWCLQLLCNTVYRVMSHILLMSKGLKVYSVYRAKNLSKGEGYLFEKPSTLWV